MTLFDDCLAVGLPVVMENGTMTMSRGLTDIEDEIFHDILDPTRVTIRLENAANLQTLKNEYQAALTRLEQIRDATNPTNAQVIAAVKDIAKYQVMLLKFLKKFLV